MLIDCCHSNLFVYQFSHTINSSHWFQFSAHELYYKFESNINWFIVTLSCCSWQWFCKRNIICMREENDKLKVCKWNRCKLHTHNYNHQFTMKESNETNELNTKDCEKYENWRRKRKSILTNDSNHERKFNE